MKKVTSKVREFCDKQELLRLAYIDKKHPRVVPVWFVVLGRNWYVGTYVNSPKWKAIQRKPAVGWVIDGGKQGKYKGMSMYGTAKEVTNKKLRTRVYMALGKKYFGTADHPKHIEVWGKVDDPNSVYIELKPEDGSWWEY